MEKQLQEINNTLERIEDLLNVLASRQPITVNVNGNNNNVNNEITY